jgi:hypothetical protein
VTGRPVIPDTDARSCKSVIHLAKKPIVSSEGLVTLIPFVSIRDQLPDLAFDVLYNLPRLVSQNTIEAGWLDNRSDLPVDVRF